ncbi:unnamed protein product [Effrenium voratum]|nr:unnamed protein product [Effrenium voratum]
MSDGFVTVGQCIEGLPIGIFVWEMLLCAFMGIFWLGALNEPTPFALGIISTDWAYSELTVNAVLAAMSVGNAVSLVLAGWLADRYGRARMIRHQLFATMAVAVFIQGEKTFRQTLWSRFLLGVSSGGLLAAIIPLVSEMLPARNRGFYLTVWCCGRPAGALFAVIVGCILPHLEWTSFVLMMMVPAVILYVLCRLDVMPESPRFLYLVGEREEGFYTLLEIYDKEMMCLPWGPESVSLTTSSEDLSDTKAGMETLPRSDAAVTALLCLTVFFADCASQCMKAWVPLTNMGAQPNPLALIAFPFLQVHSQQGLALLQGTPDRHQVMIVAQGYMLEICGVIFCAAISTVLSRRWLIRIALFLAACLSFASVFAERHSLWFTAGPLYGAALVAQSAAFNFLLVYTCEKFPTATRASAVGLVLFFGQVAKLFMPAMGILLLRRMSEFAVVLTFNSLYLIACALAFQLPLPAYRERSLHDIDEKGGRDSQRTRKRLGVTYQTV